MGRCCSMSAKVVNYVFNTILFLIGVAVTVVGVYFLVSDFNKFIEEWYVWVGLVAGVLLMVLAMIGCCATMRNNKCILSVFWVLAGVLLVLFTVAAIGASVYFSWMDTLDRMSAGGLNMVTGDEEKTYNHIRSGYGNLWQSDNCVGGVCQLDTGICEPVVCSTSVVEETYNRWLSEGVWQTNPVALSVCQLLTYNQSGFHEDEVAATSWCISNTAVMYDVRNYSLGLMISLWVVAFFMVLVSIANCVLICTDRRRKPDVIIVSTATVADVPVTEATRVSVPVVTGPGVQV